MRPSFQRAPDLMRRPLAVAAAVAVVLLIGVADYATGVVLSLSVFYVLVVVAVTVAAGTGAGVFTALLSATTWTVADSLRPLPDVSAWMNGWNSLVRAVVLGIVVWLVTVVLRALESTRQSEARSRSFLAAAAHQLRTPVAALGASVEALLLEGGTPAQERLLANIAGETSRLGRLVTALLRTARFDQGEPLRPRPFDLRTVCEEELERTRELAALDCGLVVEDGFPHEVVLDPDATRESLSNLLDNARRHAQRSIDLTVSSAGERIVLRVADDGPGLPAGAEERAFERFVTLDGRGGTGLGLAIARDLARAQDGDLVYSRRAFVLNLPLHRPEGIRSSARHRSRRPTDGAVSR